MSDASSTDTVFAGSIPGLYDKYLGPLLFKPYAAEVSDRVAALEPRWVLEVAAGTGIVTEELYYDLVGAHITATDLNPAMLEIAAKKVSPTGIEFRTADALDLPFEDSSFDVVLCQFGVMFYPDKVKGNAEALRVLVDGGTYLTVIWDRIERNPASRIASETVAALYPDNPPSFLQRTPFGYAERDSIERDLRAAGFDKIEIETVALKSRDSNARDAATGLVAGCPLAAEIQERDPHGVDAAVKAVGEALRQLERDGRFDSDLSAHIVTATK